MFELLSKLNSEIVNWRIRYRNLKLVDLEVKDALGLGAFGRVDLVTIPLIPENGFARKKISKAKAVKLNCEQYILNEKKIMEFCDSAFICK